jgi:hypothetical protein
MQPRGWIVSTALSVVLYSSIGFGQTLPPLRGVYPLGMNALNSGVTPESGFSYSNLFLFYSRNELKGSGGEVVSTGAGRPTERSVLVLVSPAAFSMLRPRRSLRHPSPSRRRRSSYRAPLPKHAVLNVRAAQSRITFDALMCG